MTETQACRESRGQEEKLLEDRSVQEVQGKEGGGGRKQARLGG